VRTLVDPAILQGSTGPRLARCDHKYDSAHASAIWAVAPIRAARRRRSFDLSKLRRTGAGSTLPIHYRQDVSGLLPEQSPENRSGLPSLSRAAAGGPRVEIDGRRLHDGLCLIERNVDYDVWSGLVWQSKALAPNMARLSTEGDLGLRGRDGEERSMVWGLPAETLLQIHVWALRLFVAFGVVALMRFCPAAEARM
jgi:hypothetical protein